MELVEEHHHRGRRSSVDPSRRLSGRRRLCLIHPSLSLSLFSLFLSHSHTRARTQIFLSLSGVFRWTLSPSPRRSATTLYPFSLTSFHHQTLTSSPWPESLLLQISSSAPQTPATAMRGAEADAMGLLLKERIVFLGNNIDDFVADAIISQLLLLDAQDPTKDIRLFINSPGGSLSATMAIFDVVRLVRADVSTVALGIAASTASIILGGGTKGKRFAMPNTRIMIHQPLGGASGQAIDVEIQAREVMHNKNNVTRIISDFTGRSFEQVEKDIDRDRYMSPIEAVEYGIIDGVIDRDSIIPLVPVPERVKSSTFNYEEVSKDPKKFLRPDIPDDEIY
ncbi:ATP-dependent Clp protease proteolytic subunit 4, chloroplastic-like [Sesamum indicum]|uniref:ATP-dependent Clp protease proteolytic subunit n=1 Tax=Sesamum indicum TaxID=4182 RepID=A0A8M8V200_SESIN|nr:ATP-dependent Clp protease proteolytic subunit 4, chloroplastic-like [Sesamum indicum]